MEGMGGVMAQMPQLPVRLNVDLANNFLPSRPLAPLGGMAGQIPQPSMGPGMVPISGFGAGGEDAPPPPPPPPVGGAGAGGPVMLGGGGVAPTLVKQDSAALQPYGSLPKVLVKSEGAV